MVSVIGEFTEPRIFIDGLLQSEVLDLLLIESSNDVATHYSCFGCGCILDGRDDLEEPLFHRDLNTEAAELATRFDLHVTKALLD